MSFTDTFIKRPVFATVLSLIILLVGAASYALLPFRQYPRVDATTVTVKTSYPGANAEIMESYIATPLESALAGVNNIDYMVSSNSQGTSNITIYFKLGTNIDSATSDVSDKVSSVSYKLPKASNSPVISKNDPNATPILYISFTSPKMSSAEITDYLQRYVQPELGTLNGVGEAEIFGSQEYAMRIWLNPKKMAARQVTATDVKNALLSNNLQSPTGRLDDPLQEFNVVAATDLKTAKQFNDLVISGNKKAQLTRISDIGEAKLGATTQRAAVTVNGVEGRVMGIIPRSDANPLQVAKLVKAQLEKLKQQMPEGLNVNINYDTTKFIDASIKEVQRTFFEAVLLVVIVIFLFLGSFRALWIPIITIPLSIIGVCTFMYAVNFTLNTLTLLAMVLAIGMVVDDAIVVLENIHRHMEEGMTPLAAAIVGAREIKFAVIAMTLTLASVYAPIGFTSGLTGSLFREFAFTLAGAVVVSGFVALTLSPMMCSKVLTRKSLEGRMAKFVDGLFTKFAKGYQKLLHVVLKLRIIIIVLFLGILAGCFYLFSTMPAELAPMEDTGAIMAIMSAPAASNLDFTRRYTEQFHDVVSKIDSIDGDVIINGIPYGVNSALSFVLLEDWSKRTRSVYQVLGDVYPRIAGITGMVIRAFPFFRLPGSSGQWPIDFVIKTSGSYAQLGEVMRKLQTEVSKNPRILNADITLKFDKPQFDVTINRNKAGILGVNMSDIGDALNIALGEPEFSQFELNGKGYYVLPQLHLPFREKASDLLNLYVRSNTTGKMIPLSNLITVKSSIVPRSLDHFQQLRSAELTASLAPGYTQGEAVEYIENVIKAMNLKGIQYDFAGQTRQFTQESGQMTILLIFAIIFIYLVLAAQFESFRDPFVVMLAVPLSITAALLALKLIGGSLNIYTWIGLVTLVGLISKHGILMVEFANQLQEKGMELKEAIVHSAAVRLRPILMTTAAMVLGALPLATASGAGMVSRIQIGIVIVSGMTFGTLLTLFVVPTMYTLIATRKEKFTTGDTELDSTLGVD